MSTDKDQVSQPTVKFTPGPWTVVMSRFYEGRATGVNPVLRHDSLIQGTPFGKDYSVALANARLIAAARRCTKPCGTIAQVQSRGS